MPDLHDRDGIEHDLTRKISKIYGAAYRDVLKILGAQESGGVDEDFWQTFQTTLRNMLAFELEDIALLSAATLSDVIGVAVNWDVINSAAAEWARGYTFDLVKGVTDTKRKLLQRQISSFYEDKLTLGQLKQRLANEFGPVRAEMIAVTEPTRANVEGERLFVQDIAARGVNMTAFWVTNEDARVCPICGARDGKKQGDGWDFYPPPHPQSAPPTHVKCRCWLRWEVADLGEAKADFTDWLPTLADVRALKAALPGSAAGSELSERVRRRVGLGVGSAGLWQRMQARGTT